MEYICKVCGHKESVSTYEEIITNKKECFSCLLLTEPEKVKLKKDLDDKEKNKEFLKNKPRQKPISLRRTIGKNKSKKKPVHIKNRDVLYCESCGNSHSLTYEGKCHCGTWRPLQKKSIHPNNIRWAKAYN